MRQIGGLKKEKSLFGKDVVNVGYGVELNTATKPQNDFSYTDSRHFSTSTVKSLNFQFLGLNMHQNQGNGGTCYGDSGGAAYMDVDGMTYIVGVTSWGDRNCISTEKTQRIDVGGSHDFVACILDSAEDESFDACLGI